MKRALIVGIILFIVVAFLVTFRVRFTETAVVTTFGKATEKPIEEPGLKFIVPYVQHVVKYDKRARYLESKPETQQTRDRFQVVATAYITWRVSNPKLFFQMFSGAGDRASNHYRGAESMLAEKLRAAMGEISQFRFDELMSATETGSKLGECEARILEHMRSGADMKEGVKGANDSLADHYGITPISVGLIGLELPEETTSRVFDRMQTNRARIANENISKGKTEAETIKSTAERDADKIIAFAKRRADEIRRQGDEEAAKYLAQLKQQPELAVYLRNMDLMREAFGNNRVTLMIPSGPGGWPGFQFFRPDLMNELKTGKLPAFDPTAVPTPGKEKRSQAETGSGAVVAEGSK